MFSALATFISSLSPIQRVTIAIGILGALAAVVAAILAWIPLWQQRRKQRLLQRRFGAEFFDAGAIARSTRYYIPPFCVNVDPTEEAEIRLVFPVKEPLFEAIDRFLTEEPSYRHCLLLADSGMGKSSFVLNYYARNQRRPQRRRHRLVVVPLEIPKDLEHINAIENPQDTALIHDA